MTSKADLDAPAHLQYAKADETTLIEASDWSGAREFPSLREALHVFMTEEPPAGKVAVIRTASGALLKPEQLEEIWASVQGP